MRLFLDANIAFSAALTDGAARKLLHELKHGGHILVMDEYVREEARRNLQIHRPSVIKELQRLRTIIDIARMETEAHEIDGIEGIPEQDIPVVKSAAVHRCDILLTGDRTHFGSFFGKQIAGVAILSPRMAAERLLSVDDRR